MNSTQNKGLLMQLIPVMLCFFAMGFVDLVGTASNYVQKDLGLSDSEANLFPSLVCRSRNTFVPFAHKVQGSCFSRFLQVC